VVNAKDNRSAVVGVGHSAVYRYDDVPLLRLAADAARAAIEDAGLEADSVDGVVTVPDAPFRSERPLHDGIDYVSAALLGRHLGLPLTWGEDVQGIIGRAFTEAINAIHAGTCTTVLVFRALPSPRGSYGHTAESRTAGLAQFELPYGSFYPTTWSQMWHRYQQKYKSGSREQMSTYVRQLRDNGLKWEYSYWALRGGRPLSFDDYMSGRLVCTPMSLYDCDIPVHAAGAFILTTSERARDLRRPPAYIHGAVTSAPVSPATLQPFTLEGEIEAGRQLAARLRAATGACPANIDTANLYDGFSFITPLWLESLGFCGEGETFDFMQDGNVSPTGSLPLNTSGGSLGAGRLHGVTHLMESVLQVTGRAGERQLKDAHLSLAAVGPQSRGSAILFSAD
jgi:acetyl-CoA acetyltransferase